MLSQEAASQLLRTYHLLDNAESVKRFMDHAFDRELELVTIKKKAIAEENRLIAWLIGSQTDRLVQQDEIEKRLWYFVHQSAYILERARLGRGLDPEVLSLKVLLKDYYKNYAHQDVILTGLAEELLFELSGWLSNDKSICRELQDEFHRLLALGGADVVQHADLQELDTQLEQNLLAYQENYCDIDAAQDQDLVRNVFAYRAASAQKAAIKQEEAIKKAHKEETEAALQEQLRDLQQVRIDRAKSFLSMTGVNIDTDRFNHCYRVYQKSFLEDSGSRIFRFFVRYFQQWSYFKHSNYGDEKPKEFINKVFIPFFQKLREYKITSENESEKDKEKGYGPLLEVIKNYIDESYAMLTTYKKFYSYDPALVCAMHELEANALGIISKDIKASVEEAQTCKGGNSKQDAMKKLGVIAPLVAMKDKLVYPIDFVTQAYEVHHDCVAECAKIGSFQPDASELKSVLNKLLSQIKLEVHTARIFSEEKEVKDNLEKLQEFHRKLELAWKNLAYLSTWVSQEEILESIKGTNNAEVNKVFEDLQTTINKPKNHPLEGYAQYKDVKKELENRIQQRDAELRYWATRQGKNTESSKKQKS